MPLHLHHRKGDMIRVGDVLIIVCEITGTNSVHLAYDGPISTKIHCLNKQERREYHDARHESKRSE